MTRKARQHTPSCSEMARTARKSTGRGRGPGRPTVPFFRSYDNNSQTAHRGTVVDNSPQTAPKGMLSTTLPVKIPFLCQQLQPHKRRTRAHAGERRGPGCPTGRIFAARSHWPVTPPRNDHMGRSHRRGGNIKQLHVPTWTLPLRGMSGCTPIVSSGRTETEAMK